MTRRHDEYDGGRPLKVDEAAERLGLKPCTVRRWILEKRIDVLRIGRRAVRVPERAIAEILDRGHQPAIEKT